MARTSKNIETTEWGGFLRSLRLQTVGNKSPTRGTWPLSTKDFAAWLTKVTKHNVSYSTYVAWEMGYREPQPKVQELIRKKLAKAELPKGDPPKICECCGQECPH